MESTEGLEDVNRSLRREQAESHHRIGELQKKIKELEGQIRTLSEREIKRKEEYTEQRGEPRPTQGKASSLQEIQAMIRKEVAAEVARRQNEPNARGHSVQPHRMEVGREQPPKQHTEEPWTKVLGRKAARAGAPRGGTTSGTDGTRASNVETQL